MTHYRTILVHLPDEHRVDAVLRVATQMATDHDAHLIGLYVMPPDVISPTFGYARGIMEAGKKTLRASAQAIAAKFEAAGTGRQLKKEWRFVEPGSRSTLDTVLMHTRAADLVIVPQRKSEWDDSLLLEFPEDVVMASGRPTLLVPHSLSQGPIGKRITLAWNDRREAARAAFDALPLLKKANNVRIVWINPENEPLPPGDLPTADIAAALARHGVRCTSAEARGSDLAVGEELMRQVEQDISDLLVMGGYGRSRMREFVFGGATRSILQQANVPVLLSH